MTHMLKIKKQFADAVQDGTKTFEIRKNDKNFHVGDKIIFSVVADNNADDMVVHPLTGAVYLITYILTGWGLEDGYVALGIRRE